jgi:predicted dehydrogenase
MPTNAPIRLIIAGAGSRGFAYGNYAIQHPDEAVVVGVAEPRQAYRERFASQHNLPADAVFEDWTQLAERAARGNFADAVVISTPDALHTAPAVAFAKLGLAMLLEKPMAPSADECRQIYQAVRQAGIIFAVCHVLRYTAYTTELKKLVDAGTIGEIVSVQHLEPVGYWHQAHSFVRGNWRNTAESSFMLLQKSCHDIDWLRYIIGRNCERVSSFGSLTHFRKEQKPAAAGQALRCIDCAIARECPYSASRLYFGLLERGITGWPVNVITPDVTPAGVEAALRNGPYGRCAYECDNDVVDHQVVNLLYSGGATASFTMTAFTPLADRKTTLFGTRGQLSGDGRIITHFDFSTETTREIDTLTPEVKASGHGGGDFGLMRSFLDAVRTGDQSLILSGPDETLETHLTVFAAERSRLEGQTLPVEL